MTLRMCRLVTVTRSGIHRDPVTETVIVERPGPGTWHLVLQQLCSMAGQVGSGLHYSQKVTNLSSLKESWDACPLVVSSNKRVWVIGGDQLWSSQFYVTTSC